MDSSKLFRTMMVSMLVPATCILAACSGSTTGSKANGADPGVLEAPIAYVKRPIALDDNDNELQQDLRDPLFFVEGGDVYLRSNSTVTGTEINITASVTGGQGDVKDLRPSYDGTKLLFSLRLFDPNPNDDDTPSWNIYEYDLETASLRRIIAFDSDAEEGDDVAPAYLADGRIIFSSNRQRQSKQLLTDEFKPPFRALDEDRDSMTMVLHVMNDDGTEIRQVSFNQSHDLDPTLLTHNYPGEVMFTRWDNAGANNAMNLYKMRPDGTDLQVLYGVHSHNTGANNDGSNDETIQFSQPEEMEDGRVMVLARPYTNTYGGGDIVIIDVENYANNTQPVDSLSGLSGPAQTSATINQVSTANELSLSGRYSAAYPLWDGTNRILVSKSTCAIMVQDEPRPCIEPYLSDPTALEISPAYGLWLYDMDDHSEKPILAAEPGVVMTEVVALQSRTPPRIIFDKAIGELDAGWRTDGIGAIHIRSVYDFGNGGFDGCFLTDCTTVTGITSVSELGDPANAMADDRPARFVRFVKAVAIPDEDDPELGNAAPDLAREAFGPQINQGMREIIGYAPVEPDGSVKVKLPANIPLMIDVLDRMGRRMGPRHENWFTVRPGDTLECTGCHTETTQNNAVPNIHHRRDAEAASINPGLLGDAEVFPNTQIPGTSLAYSGTYQQTMAEVRFDQVVNAIPPADEPQVTPDVVYEDYWTDPSVRALDAMLSYEYGNLDPALLSPASAACDPWTFLCRILINYEQHIHPLWSLPRLVDTDNDGNPDVDNTCTSCHNSQDAMGNAMLPDGQLSLVEALDADENDPRYKSYLELLFADAGQTLDGGQLVNITLLVAVDADGDGIQDVDINGVPIFDTVDDPAARVQPSMSANGARASFFIEKMSSATATRNGSAQPGDVEYVDHSSFMSADELRMVIEWLDIGAQYFNDPFDPAVPMN